MQLEQELRLLGSAVREVREQRGIAIAELAAVTGVDRVCIEALEAGRLDPALELLVSIAGAIGVRLSVLIVRAEALGAAGSLEPRP